MKFSINQSEFNAALSVVFKGVSTRATLPIFSGILIKAQNGMLVLESTNMDQSIRSTCTALVEEEGSTVVPARLLTDIVKTLPDAAIHMSYSDDVATILCDTSSFSLKTLNALDFPGFPQVEPENTVNIPFKVFSSMVKRVGKAVSRDDSHPILSGVLVDVEEETLKMVATDSYRLSYEQTKLEQAVPSFSAVVSGSFLADLASLSGDYEFITLGLSENQIIAEYGNHTFINRRIEGNYPNYEQLLPQKFNTRVTYQTKQFIDAVKRTSLLTNNTSPIRLDINEASQTTQISTTTQDIGAAQETIGSPIEGKDIEIAFNAHYLLDGLATFNDAEIYFEMIENTKPGIFKTKDGNYIYLIMPVHIA